MHQADQAGRSDTRGSIRFVGQVMAVVLTLTLLSWHWLLAYRTPVEALDLTLPVELEPGRQFVAQEAVNCDWYHYAQQPDVLDCWWRDYNFSLNPKTRIIQRTVLWMQLSSLTIGRLILIWGQPTGFRRSGLLVRVYWPRRYVYVIDRRFRPESQVRLVVWSDEAGGDPWQGFRE